MTIKTLREIALSFPESKEEPHFENTSFRVRKKIFATYDTVKNRSVIKLSEIDQDVFSSIKKDHIYAVPNKWGKQGWTIFEINDLEYDIMKDALKCAYCEVAPQKLKAIVQNAANDF